MDKYPDLVEFKNKVIKMDKLVKSDMNEDNMSKILNNYYDCRVLFDKISNNLECKADKACVKAIYIIAGTLKSVMSQVKDTIPNMKKYKELSTDERNAIQSLLSLEFKSRKPKRSVKRSRKPKRSVRKSRKPKRSIKRSRKSKRSVRKSRKPKRSVRKTRF